MFVIAAFSLQTIIQLNCQLTGLSFTNNCCTTSLLTDRPPGSEPGGTQRYDDVRKCLCECECMWMMRARPVHQAGGISTPACDPLGFRYWWTNQWAHWGCRLVLEFQNNIQYVLLRVCSTACVFMRTIRANAWTSLHGSNVRGFSTISAAIRIFVSECIQNARNPSANPSHTQTDGFPNKRGCVSVSPDHILCHPAGGLTSVTLNNSICLPKRSPFDRSNASVSFSHPRKFPI